MQRIQKNGKWASCLTQIQALLNSHTNSVTHLSATQLAFGYQPRLHSLPQSSDVVPSSENPNATGMKTFSRLAGQLSMHNCSTSKQDKLLLSLADLMILQLDKQCCCLTISLLTHMAINWHLSGKDPTSFRGGFRHSFIILSRPHQRSLFWPTEITCVVFSVGVKRREAIVKARICDLIDDNE